MSFLLGSDLTTIRYCISAGRCESNVEIFFFKRLLSRIRVGVAILAFINADLNNIRGDVDLVIPNYASVHAVDDKFAKEFVESFL